MNRIPIVVFAVVSSAALLGFLSTQPAHSVFAASAQTQSVPLKTGQSQSTGQSQQPGNGVVIVLNGKPMTPIEQLQLETSGILDQVKNLQAQLKTDETTIHALQSSLQTLQTQFANHSHKVMNMVPGHVCTGINQFLVTQAGTGRQVQVGLEVVQACSNPKWNGSTPSSWEALNVSTPVEGAQNPQ